MEPATQRFIEKTGQLFEADGLARSAGRIFACLLLAPEPLSHEELASSLRISKASVSTNTRLLERLGALERVTRPGDRRDYFRIEEDMSIRMMEMRLEKMRQTRAVLSEGLESSAAEGEAVRRRLESSIEFFDLMIAAITDTRDAWLSRHPEDGRSAGAA